MTDSKNTPSPKNESVTPHVLFKFGDEVHLRAFEDRGELFLRKADYFRRLENDGRVRSDPWEGFDFIGQPHRGKLKIILKDGQTIEPKLAGPVLMNRGWSPVPHVYCMTVLIEELASVAHAQGQRLLDLRLAEFGNHVAIVADVDEFLRRLEMACANKGLRYQYAPVRYLPVDHHGEVGPLEKNSEYEWQSEFRVIVYGIQDQETRIELGSLKDIVRIGSSEEVLGSISYTPPS